MKMEITLAVYSEYVLNVIEQRFQYSQGRRANVFASAVEKSGIISPTSSVEILPVLKVSVMRYLHDVFPDSLS